MKTAPSFMQANQVDTSGAPFPQWAMTTSPAPTPSPASPAATRLASSSASPKLNRASGSDRKARPPRRAAWCSSTDRTPAPLSTGSLTWTGRYRAATASAAITWVIAGRSSGVEGRQIRTTAPARTTASPPSWRASSTGRCITSPRLAASR